MKKILICDDDSNTRERWKGALQAITSVKREFEVQTIGIKDFKSTLTDLEARRRKARGQEINASKWGKNLFDSVTVLIVDYDLLKFNKEDYLTGEGVAYLARCYSRCGFIIALNQFGENVFDLTMTGHPDSFADLNLGSRQLSNSALWHEPWKGFRPSFWPMLPMAVKSFEARVQGLQRSLNSKILSYLQFSPEISATLPRSTQEFLGKGKRVEDVTFKQFVEESGNGLRRKDMVPDTESLARIAASRVWKWLERMVLSGQDVLVDAPHLVSRFPSLLSGSAKTISNWNKTASFKAINRLGIRYQALDEFRFKRQDWLSRPAWFWKPLSNFDKIAEVTNPWAAQRPDFVFAEDLSKFVAQNKAREFVAHLPSPFVRRYVFDKEAAMGKLPVNLKGVEYVPAVRFSM
jgi:hypothetical protein